MEHSITRMKSCLLVDFHCNDNAEAEVMEAYAILIHDNSKSMGLGRLWCLFSLLWTELQVLSHVQNMQ